MLDEELQAWKDQLPASLQFGDSRSPLVITSERHKTCTQYLQASFNGSMIAVHAIFHYPWTARLFDAQSTSLFEEQQIMSTIRAAEAARSLILATKYTELNVNSPNW